MRFTLLAWSVLGCSPAALAQAVPVTMSPELRDLSSGTPGPLMFASSRVQQFYEASELGSRKLVISSLALRYDAAQAGVLARKHTIARLRIAVGVTDLGIDETTAVFDDNLTHPLRTVVDAAGFEFETDSSASSTTDGWGAHDGSLRFTVSPAVPIEVPSGGSFVLELRVEGNSNTMLDPAMLDMHFELPDPLVQSVEDRGGYGCGHSTCDVVGQYELGTAFHVSGDGFAPNVPIATLVTFEFLVPPVKIGAIGSSNCRLYLDPATGPILDIRFTDATGALAPFEPGSGVPLPRDPGLCGDLLYVQNIAPLPGGGGLQASDYRTIAVGCPGTPTVRARQVVHHADANADVATATIAGGLALKIE